jgi:hypothetical protein
LTYGHIANCYRYEALCFCHVTALAKEPDVLVRDAYMRTLLCIRTCELERERCGSTDRRGYVSGQASIMNMVCTYHCQGVLDNK